MVSSIPPKYNKNAYLMQLSEEISFVKLLLVWVKLQYSYLQFFINWLMNISNQHQPWFSAIQESWHSRSRRNSTDSQHIFQKLERRFSLVEFLTQSIIKSWRVLILLILSLVPQEESRQWYKRRILTSTTLEFLLLMSAIRCLKKLVSNNNQKSKVSRFSNFIYILDMRS